MPTNPIRPSDRTWMLSREYLCRKALRWHLRADRGGCPGLDAAACRRIALAAEEAAGLTRERFVADYRHWFAPANPAV